MKFRSVFIIIGISTDLFALERNTPIATPSIQEMSRGFASIFTADKVTQNIISGIMTPFMILLIIATIVYICYRVIKYIDFREKQKKMYLQQLIMFKAKEKGLSNYQIKILKGIIEILQHEEAMEIMTEPLIFEKYIKNFIRYIRQIEAGNETMETICSNIITIYEKIYHGNDIRRPLASPAELEKNTLVAVSSENGNWYICKLKSVENEGYILYIINNPTEKEIRLNAGDTVKSLFFRGGDAEYRFDSSVINSEGALLKLRIPEKMERGEPVPHPLIDVNIQCEIIRPGVTDEERAPIEADLFRLNETEAVIRIDARLKHGSNNEIKFTISDFLIHAGVHVIGEKALSGTTTYYYNIKFTNISDAAVKVIYNFLESSLFDV